jgi:probable RNA-binding protein EIF1AD
MPRKGVKQATVDAPELIPGKRILCKIQGTPRGNNIFEASDGTDIFIVQLPNRYRKSLWVRSGSYVIVELLEGSELKVGGEIVHVLLADEVKERRKGSDWCVQIYYS